MKEKISEVENELHEASEEVRKLPVERRTAEVEKPRVSDGRKALKVKLDLLLREVRRRLERVLKGDQRSLRSTGSSQKTRKAAVRKESAGTQDNQPSQLNNMDVDVDENKKELSFIPIAVSSSDDWHLSKIMCDRECPK